MTLKQRKFNSEIRKPENKLNMAACMRKANYSKASVRAGTQYKILRKITQKLDFFDPDQIKADIKDNRKKADKLKNVAVVQAIDQHRSKIAGMITDKSQVDNLNPDKVIIEFTQKEKSSSLVEEINNRIGSIIPQVPTE